MKTEIKSGKTIFRAEFIAAPSHEFIDKHRELRYSQNIWVIWSNRVDIEMEPHIHAVYETTDEVANFFRVVQENIDAQAEMDAEMKSKE